ncbi:transcription factor zinc-finger [Leptospira wolbachii serovar Codice str. CDC]|uniref:Transcription factor zinc-finger n=1 Tax=Leptospira wolbachii serovar Codice str. CDC TaxID=1218599 RepID=R8ZXW3_9LEPT|nr:zf-TFIIB domain-containing protein [Leptospira wolbachii]EOQ94768.1 transcription factor zinc-finger [Leptospira wolbachii serovar Codice str. CDC]
MKKCQKCKTTLSSIKTNYGKMIICPVCFGHYYSEKTLEILFKSLNWKEIKENSKIKKSKIVCPKCNKKMNLYTLPSEFNNVQIDLCNSCKILWLDKDEIEELKLSKFSNPNLDTINKSQKKITERDINYILQVIKLDSKLTETKSKKNINNFATDYSPNTSNRSIFNAFDILTFIKTIFTKENNK